jgi:hypothetical protein
VVIEDKESVVALKSGYLSLCPNALAAGIGDDTTQENAYCDGIAVFVGDPHLAGAPIAEWLIDFEPLDDLAHVAGNVP